MMEEIISRLGHLPGLSAPLGVHSVFIFCAATIAGQLFLFPVSPFSWFAGLVFGFWQGTGLILMAKMLSALVNFSCSRWLGRGWARRCSGRYPLLEGMNEALERDGLKMAILLRMCPIPFSVANYSYGLTRMSLPSFLAATFIAILLPSLTLVGLGASMKGGTGLLDPAHNGSHWENLATGLSVLASILVARRLSGIAMKRVAERRASEQKQP